MLRTQLLAIQTAITNILTTGQSYVRPGLSLTHANLKDLESREQTLIRGIQRAEGGIITVAEVGHTTTTEDEFTNADSP